MSNKLCALLGCQIPLVVSPMLGVGDVQLARVAATCGAVGSIPCSGLPPPALTTVLQDTAPLTEKLNFNFFTHVMPTPTPEVSREWMTVLAPFFEREGIPHPQSVVEKDYSGTQTFTAAVLESLRRGGVKVVSFHFGLPEDGLWKAVRSYGWTTLASATTVKEALYLKEKGVDVIVVQGWEAGGHRGCFLPDTRIEEQQGTFALLPQVRRALGAEACLVVAGGVVDATTVRAAMQLGADGVQVGTAFLRCTETKTSAVHRQALKEAAARNELPQITNVLSGRPARGLTNVLMRELGALRGDAPPFPYGASYLKTLRATAESHGRPDYSPLWCGQNISACEECSVAEKINHLSKGFL